MIERLGVKAISPPKIGVSIILVMCAVLALFPIAFMAMGSLKQSSEFLRDPLALPRDWTFFDNYRAIWIRFDILRLFLNTVAYIALSPALSGSDFWTPLRNNAIFLLAIPGILILSMVVSVLLYEQVHGWKFFRSVYYLPTILSAAVVGMLMRIMFSGRGAANAMLESIGLGGLTQDWLGSASTAFIVLIFAFYWQTLGQGVLIFLAGLSSIPGDILEAAQLDGASWWQRLRQIIMPMMVPAIAYFAVVNAIWAFVGVFGLVYTVTGGGPGYSTTPLDLMIYRRAFQFGDMGYASAMSVLLFCLVLAISAVQLRVFDRLTND